MQTTEKIVKVALGNIAQRLCDRCVREDTKQALKGNLQADGVQSRQTLFVRYCPISQRAETRSGIVPEYP